MSGQAAAEPGETVPSEPTPPWTLCAVAGPFQLDPPRPLTAGNLVEHGLPFYVGRISYSASLTLAAAPAGSIWLTLERLSVPVVEVRVNGQPAGHLAWRPYRLAIDALLEQGENAIELVLYHSLRNLLGPHHSPLGEEYGVGPHSFRGQEKGWSERLVRGESGPDWRASYALTEFGLFGAVKIVAMEQGGP